MSDRDYKVVLRSYGEEGLGVDEYYLSSTVSISCKHYETFCKLVDAVRPILNEEHREGDID